MKQFPRIVIAGVASGSGKTSLTMGLLRAFVERGVAVAPFKCGPDYLDPGHLEAAAGKPCRNLDPVLMGEEAMLAGFTRAAAQAGISIIEGVMGLYDGKDGKVPVGSTAHVAKLLQAPVIVIIDAKASAQTAGAVALGIKMYDPDCPVAGFLVNRIGSPRHFEMVRKAIEDATGLPVIGWVPKDKAIDLPSRHLGLVAAWEKDENGESPAASMAAKTAALFTDRVDFDRLLKVAQAAPPLPILPQNGAKRMEPAAEKTPVRIGVAMDDAFHFYYQDNLDIVRELGAKLVPFSPLQDERLPDGLSGLYFGGGYPELHAETLAGNSAMREAILKAAGDDLPILAECGGLMYLVQSLTVDGKTWPMVGIFPEEITMARRLSALGYYTAKTTRESMIGPAGMPLVGHIFRWSDWSVTKADDETCWLLALDKEGQQSFDGLAWENTVASYLHVHFAGCPEVAANFVAACRRYKVTL